MHNDSIGVDVSKDHLEACRLADGASRRFANDKCGRKAFVKWCAETPVVRVVFEPTGPYHRAFYPQPTLRVACDALRVVINARDRGSASNHSCLSRRGSKATVAAVTNFGGSRMLG